MSDLDAEELFHLALKADEEGDRDKTLSYLKRSIAVTPLAPALYLLGAEYAELGMLDRAITHLQQAVSLRENLWTANFQLGLMQLAVGQEEEARSAWAPLLDLDREDYLYHFGKGLTHLLDEESIEALQCLNRGVTLNHDNPALNRDVANIMTNIQANGPFDQEEQISEPASELREQVGNVESDLIRQRLASKYGGEDQT